MPFDPDGSRVLTANKTPIVAINIPVTLPGLEPFIYCGGVFLDTPGEVFDVASGHTSEWWWRAVGGTFAVVAVHTEISYGENTDLVNGNTISATYTNGTSIARLRMFELEGLAGGVIQGTLTGSTGESSESQIALSLVNAVPGRQYEMMMRCTYSAGTVDMVYESLITCPIPRMKEATIPAPLETVDNFSW